MKMFLFINLLFNLYLNTINNFFSGPTYIYEYSEVKEIRYIYFYNLEVFDINNIEIYIADQKIDFNYNFLDYYIIDLENYYPLSSLKIKINNFNSVFSLKISNTDDFLERPFVYQNINNNTISDINTFIFDTPKWNLIKTNKLLEETKILKRIK
ncbi:MAG: hypothetical protein HFI87_04790 [Bacilli bacterium]|nr:hypothetical protein [Bacilli bacterium]